MSRLLLVEDDKNLGETLRERLCREGHEVHWVTNLQRAQEALRGPSTDLIILDVGLPDGSGFEFARMVRRSKPTPFIFVTARSEAEDRLTGYELGAEEYIPKPFHLREFLLRVQHVLQDHANRECIQIGRYTIDFTGFQVRQDTGEAVPVASRDLKLLQLLIQAAPRVLSRDEILENLWGEDQFPTNRTIDNAIVRLRQLLGSDGEGRIRSVRGVGYQWISQEEAWRM